MFYNIGDLIKKATIVLSFLSVVGFLLGGYFIGMRYDKPAIIVAMILVGPLVTLIYAFYAYGFGVLVENSEFIFKSIRSIEKSLSEKKDNESDANNTVSKA